MCMYIAIKHIYIHMYTQYTLIHIFSQHIQVKLQIRTLSCMQFMIYQLFALFY